MEVNRIPNLLLTIFGWTIFLRLKFENLPDFTEYSAFKYNNINTVIFAYWIIIELLLLASLLYLFAF